MDKQKLESAGVQIDRGTRKTLVPIDGSREADEAFEFALETFPETDITALHVLRVPEGYWAAFLKSEEQSPQYELLVSDAKKLLEAAQQKAFQRDIEIKTVVKWGKPAQTIVDQANKGKFNQIVIGSHGRRGLARLLYGSISESVVRRSPISVFIVRHTDEICDIDAPSAILASD